MVVTLKSRLVEKGSYSWHVPVVVKCSNPFTKLPTSERLNAEILPLHRLQGRRHTGR